MKRQHHCYQEPPIPSRRQQQSRQQDRIGRPENRDWTCRCCRRKAQLHRPEISDSDQSSVNDGSSKIFLPKSTSATQLTYDNFARVETVDSSNRQSSEHRPNSRENSHRRADIITLSSLLRTRQPMNFLRNHWAH